MLKRPLRAIFARRRSRLIAYISALGILLAVSAIFTVSSWQRAVERHERDLETRVVLGSNAVNAYLVSAEQSFADLSDRLLADTRNERTQLLLQRYKKNHPEFEVISVIGMDGETITDMGPVANAADAPFFIDLRQRLEKGERMAISRPFYGRSVPKWLVHLRYGVRDTDGKLRFTVGGSFAVGHAQSFWHGVPLAPGADMGLLRDDMYAIARYPEPTTFGPEIYSKPQPGLLSDYLPAHGMPASGMIRGYSLAIDGIGTVAFQHLKDYPLYFVSLIPRSVLLREWWASAWPTYGLLLLLFICGLLLVQWIGARQAAAQREREARVIELERLAGELSRNKEELEHTMARLEAANAEMEAYMYSVSHDLRAPIRAIDGYSALLALELELAPDSEAARLLGRVRTSTGRMTELLSDLLDLSRYSMQELRKEPIAMRAMVDSVIAELGAEAQVARIEIDALPGAYGDAGLLRQVWINLIGNALKYSARGSQPVISIGYAREGYYVADNGIGFDMAHTDKLFRLFSRLHAEESYPGTGVGLAIVKRIVERHGGTVSAESRPGMGAMFRFTVPTQGTLAPAP